MEIIPRVIGGADSAAAPPTAPENGFQAGHDLPETAFDLLAAGPGDPAAMMSLADSHWSIIRALVAAIASDLGGDDDIQRAAAEGWTLLCALDTEQPEAVRDVLTYPYVRVWAMQCLRPAASADSDLDRAHLAGLAAAAAWQAGAEVELVLPVREGSIYLPGAGVLALGAGAGRTQVVRISPAGPSTRDGTGRWQPVHRVSAGEWSVTVDDVDPFRDCQAWRPTGRLPAQAQTAWRLGLTAAARRLAVEVPGYSRVIEAGLRSVVPIRSGAAGNRQSGTAREAFGAMALAFPGEDGALSELLVHEMQHAKLAALCDLRDLFDRTDNTLHAVPWRSDRRPTEGLLHGTYAFLAVAELWRSRARLAPDEAARDAFLTYRSWTEEGIGALLGAAALTPEGRRFVDGMRTTVRGWADDD